MFQTVPLPIIRSFALYTQQWYMSYRFADSLRAVSGPNWLASDGTDLVLQNQTSSVLILLASCQQNLYEMYHCCVYSEKFLMMKEELSEKCIILFQK